MNFLTTQRKRPLVCVQGLGFVGSAMSVAVASASNKNGKPLFDVIGVDLPNQQGQKRVNSINKGCFPFLTNDEYLQKEIFRCWKQGNLTATCDDEVFKLADIIIIDIQLDVDFKKKHPSTDFENFKSSIKKISEKISPGTLVILETTVPPGTSENVVLPLFRQSMKNRGLKEDDFFFCHSYERVMPGPNYLNSIKNFWRVYSGENKQSEKKCKEFFSKIINTKSYPLKKLSSLTASETAKILENSYRAANIAFVDEWGAFAEKTNLDIFEILDVIRDRPTHSNIKQPGFGVGGYCLTKDPYFPLISSKKFYSKTKFSFPFLNLLTQVNTAMPLRNLDRIENVINSKLKNKKILIMGVTYKPNVADTRYSATEVFYKEALNRGAKIKVHDPYISFWPELSIKIENSLPSLENIDIIVFCVKHDYYTNLNLTKWIQSFDLTVYDCDNVISIKKLNKLKNKGIKVFSTGRGF